VVLERKAKKFPEPHYFLGIFYGNRAFAVDPYALLKKGWNGQRERSRGTFSFRASGVTSRTPSHVS